MGKTNPKQKSYFEIRIGAAFFVRYPKLASSFEVIVGTALLENCVLGEGKTRLMDSEDEGAAKLCRDLSVFPCLVL